MLSSIRLSSSRRCPGCRKQLPGRAKKFCNRSCAAKYNNHHFPKRTPQGHCKTCNLPLRAGLRYCGRACKWIARRKKRQGETVNRRATWVRSVQSWRKRLKLKAVDYKGGRCQYCGYCKCLQALEFHHRNPKEKDFTISRITASWARIKKELDKCVLTCANCHREIHSGLIAVLPC